MPISCLVLDCDGVILESIDIKMKAMERIAAPYGQEAATRLVMYHRMHEGVSRYIKFAWFFEEILGKKATEADLEAWNERFIELANAELKTSDLVPGIEDVLKTWHKILPIYVCSGAPQADLPYILEARGIAHYFTGIYGSPPAKAALLANIVRMAKADPSDVLMVGDASLDLYAAEEVGTQFYGRGKRFQGGKYPYGEDLSGLNAWITEHKE